MLQNVLATGINPLALSPPSLFVVPGAQAMHTLSFTCLPTDGILAIGISTACIVASIKIGGAGKAGDAGIVNDLLLIPQIVSSHRVFWPRALSPHQDWSCRGAGYTGVA